MIAMLLAAAAQAAGWSEPRPYVLPILNLTIVSVDGTTAAQASAGLTGGARLAYRDPPNWLSHTRGSLVGTYGLNTGSLGADLRVGSFIGPDTRFLQYQVGPDVWFNGYGTADALDYYLPWSPGVDLHNVLTFKIVRELQIVGEATPGWAFEPSRQTGGIGPFHELTLAGLVVIKADVLRLTVGYARQWRSFGESGTIILSGAI